MMQVPADTTLDPDAPLGADDREAVSLIVASLHSSLRALLSVMPVEAQTASGLARYLGVERTTCQRVVSAVNRPFTGVEVAAELPGPEGLRLLTSSSRNKRGSGADVAAACEALSGAIDQYDALIRRLAGTRSKLLKRLTHIEPHEPAGLDEERHLAQRRALFEAAAALTGRYSQTWLAAHIYEQPDARTGMLTQTRAHGLLGHVGRADALPLATHVFATSNNENREGEKPPAGEPTFVPLEPQSDPETPPGILTDFSTRPLPRVRSRQPDRFLLQNVEPAPGAAVVPIDMIFAMKGQIPDPSASKSKLDEVWGLVNFPARRLLLDVFLERELARRCIPDLDVHLWGPDFAAHSGQRWQTRFPSAPRLHWLGAGLAQAATDSHARHVELLSRLFAARNLDPQRFIGFRCEVHYPMWRTGYRMSLDFGDAGD